MRGSRKTDIHTYSDVWVVFDKDDFPDFDDAIKAAIREDFSVAWSNQSFELWSLLHFQNVTTSMDNSVLTEKLTTHLQRASIIDRKYSKMFPISYDDLKAHVHVAVGRSEKLMERCREDKKMFESKMNPATTVHELVGKLLPYLE